MSFEKFKSDRDITFKLNRYFY